MSSRGRNRPPCAAACRALSLVATNDSVPRDMFYNGDVKAEPGAVVCRVAPSFVRFGTFQLPVSRGAEEAHLTRKLAEYVIRHHFPEFAGRDDRFSAMLREVAARTARLVAQWQLVGFVHGVTRACCPLRFAIAVRSAALPELGQSG